MERLSILYATALFSLAMDNDCIDEFEEQAAFIRDTLMDEDCRRIIVHPHVTESEKRDFFSNAFASRVRQELLGFLFLVVEKNRETFLIPALTELIEKIKRYKGMVTANVTFAAHPDDVQVAEVKDTLSGKLQKTVDVSVRVDPSVIGGPYIFVDGYYMDWTVKTRLNELTSRIKETV